MGASSDTCDNCAIESAERVAVHRIYPAIYEVPERQLESIEWWCVSCVTQYPNALAEPAPDAALNSSQVERPDS